MMAINLRDVCEKNKKAEEIAFKVKEEELSVAHRRLQESELSTRSLTKEPKKTNP